MNGSGDIPDGDGNIPEGGRTERKDSMTEKSQKRIRYQALDELRGLVFISMVLYHGMWDLVYMFGYEAPWYQSTAGYVWQQSICWSFILLSGFCWSFGREKYRHAALVFGGGFLITLVTCLFLPEDRVIFGVLTLLGTAAFVTTLLQPVLSRCRPALGLLVSALLFVVTRNVNQGFLGFEGWHLLWLPEAWYQNLVTTFLGFPSENFYSTDYFSLIPWVFLYLSGYFLYRFVAKRHEPGEMSSGQVRKTGEAAVGVPKTEPAEPEYRLPSLLENGRIPPLRWIGQHSLLLYLLHQPMIFVLLQIWHVIFYR